MNITINLSTANLEIVNYNIISKLYNLISGNSQHNVTLSGNLYSATGYKLLIDTLVERFSPNLIITVPEKGQYLIFVDPLVENILKNTIGDGVGVTVSDATNANLGTIFKNNTTITSFNEFPYFTKANTNPPVELFRGCTNLTNVDFTNTTKFVGNEFSQSGVTTINAPNLETISGLNCFANSGLVEIQNLGNIYSIDGGFALGCVNLRTVNLPTSCTTIMSKAFRSCTNLETINLLFVTSYPLEEAFSSCTTLHVNASELQNTTIIGTGTFQNTLVYGNLYLPKLISLGINAFYNSCANVSKITCLGKISSIGKGTFDCQSLGTSYSEVILPYECVSIDMEAFRNAKLLSSVKQYTLSIDDWIDGEEPETTTNLRITSIGNGAFYNNSSLTNIDLSNVTTLGNSAFYGCSSLINVRLGNITVAQESIFSGCTALSSINISFENLTDIKSSAFRKCGNINWGVLRYLQQYMNPTVLNNITVSNVELPFNSNTFELFYLPNLKYTSGSSYSGNIHWSIGMFGSGFSTKNTTYGLLYLRDIEGLFPATFANANITSLVINNTTVPICYNTSFTSNPNNSQLKELVFLYMSNTTIIYVPDSAINLYKTADVWSNLSTRIHPMSELTRYATEADWITAGKPATGLIEAYM